MNNVDRVTRSRVGRLSGTAALVCQENRAHGTLVRLISNDERRLRTQPSHKM